MSVQGNFGGKKHFKKSTFTCKSKTCIKKSSFWKTVFLSRVGSRFVKGPQHPNIRLWRWKKHSWFLKWLPYFQGPSPIWRCQRCRVRVNVVGWQAGQFGERTKVYRFGWVGLDRGSYCVCFTLSHNAKVFVFVCLWLPFHSDWAMICWVIT